MIGKALYSSASGEWETPPEIFDPLNEEFKFTLDAAANRFNAKVPNYLGLDNGRDAFENDWTGNVWLNPPYGRGIGAWIQNARVAVRYKKADVVVCLVPVRTDTAWWHENVTGIAEVRFIRGRIKFVGAQSSAPFPSAILIYDRLPR